MNGQTSCDHCFQVVHFKSRMRGKQVSCPGCGESLQIPETDEDEIIAQDDGQHSAELRGSDDTQRERNTRQKHSRTSQPKRKQRSRRVWLIGGAAVVLLVGVGVTVFLLWPRGPKAVFWKYAKSIAEDDWGSVYDLSSEAEKEIIHKRMEFVLRRPSGGSPDGLSKREQFIQLSQEARKRNNKNVGKKYRSTAAKRRERINLMKVEKVEIAEDGLTATVHYIVPANVTKETIRDYGLVKEVVSRDKSISYERGNRLKQYFVKEEGVWKLTTGEDRGGNIKGMIF